MDSALNQEISLNNDKIKPTMTETIVNSTPKNEEESKPEVTETSQIVLPELLHVTNGSAIFVNDWESKHCLRPRNVLMETSQIFDPLTDILAADGGVYCLLGLFCPGVGDGTCKKPHNMF